MRSQSADKPRLRPAQVPAAPHPSLFLLAAGICLVGLIGVYLFFVRTTTGQYIDESALEEATALAQGRTAKATTQFLDYLPVISLVLASAAVLFVAIRFRRRLAAVVAVVTAAGANLSTQWLKADVFDRPFRGISTLDFNSLPSGHTTLAASAAAAVFLVVAPRWRPLAAFGGGSYAVATGVSTLVNQWHRPADVVAAFLVVGFWTALGGLAILRTGTAWNTWDGYGEHWASSQLWPLLSALAGVGAAGVAVYSLAQIAPGSAQHVSTVNYLWAGACLIVIFGYLLTVAGTVLFGGAAGRRTRPELQSAARRVRGTQ